MGGAEDAMEAMKENMGSGPGGIVKKFVFISTPMWACAVLLTFSDIKPAPALPGGDDLQPLAPGSFPDGGAKKVEWLEVELEKALAEAAKYKKKVEALEADLAMEVSSVVSAIDAIPAQGVIATLAGFLGVLAVAGPSTYVRGFLAIVGSYVAALFVAGWAAFFQGEAANPFWLDNVANVACFRGRAVEWLLFLTILGLGVARWLTNWQCGIYNAVEEIEVSDNGDVAVLNAPLLGAGAGRPGLPPPSTPPPARDAV